MTHHPLRLLSFSILWLAMAPALAQPLTAADVAAQLPGTQVDALESFAASATLRSEAARQAALEQALLLGWPVRSEGQEGRVMELQALVSGRPPRYYMTDNLNAADSVSTDEVWPGGSAGLSLTGSGMVLGEWDGGKVRSTHQEFGGRVTQSDSASTLSAHSTHVAGTMIAAGVAAQAKGMAYQATLGARDWNSDSAEMASAAAGGLLLSNHSYGIITGWYYNYLGDGLWVWFGDESVSTVEDANFGFYDSETQTWDQIAVNAPYYLIVKSAGNDRNDSGPTPGTQHWYYSNTTHNWALSTAVRDPDGGTTGYDTLPTSGVAKNILTVGAVGDLIGGWSSAAGVSMSSFSGWGPTDDGRIKPDLVANGVGLYSSISSNDSSYASYSGTSMAAPSTTGSLALLQQHYQNTHGGSSLRSATLKALVLNTTDEAGSYSGPDYAFGWGLLNTLSAAQLISQLDSSAALVEQSLTNGSTYSLTITATGGPIRATLAWTDPAATPPTWSLDPTTSMLVNDLDLRLSQGGSTWYPWVLDPANPASAATTGDNSRDNVEQIYLAAPTSGQSYTLTVSHKGSLSSAPQPFSLVVSGGVAGVSCDGDSVVISNRTFSGTTSCVATTSITTQGTVVVESGADVTFTAPTIQIQSGFSAVSGSSFHAGQ